MRFDAKNRKLVDGASERSFVAITLRPAWLPMQPCADAPPSASSAPWRCASAQPDSESAWARHRQRDLRALPTLRRAYLLTGPQWRESCPRFSVSRFDSPREPSGEYLHLLIWLLPCVHPRLLYHEQVNYLQGFTVIYPKIK